MGSHKSDDRESLLAGLEAHGQAHVLDFWDRLSASEQKSLGLQASSLLVDLGELMAQQRLAVAALEADAPDDEIGPALDAIVLPEHGGDPKRFQAAGLRGEKLLKDGRVGILVVAGGQGTRLGFPGPKGGFSIGPVSDRSLFALQAQKIRGLSRRCGRAIPWYVMTSRATDGETRALFEARDYFGLDPDLVFIFSQGMLPAWDFRGRLLLESPDRICESPDGHGGVFTALEGSGALDDMANRGIDRIFYYQVDNPLVRIGDPFYLGFHEETGAEMSCKVIRKQDPMEKVGVVASKNGRAAMIEYTELGDSQRFDRDSTGELVYWAGSIAVHVFNLDFARRIAGNSEELLPLHAAAKKIACAGFRDPGETPEQPNGYKLERFVFDALPQASRVCVLETRADEEFAPVKNAEGRDSPSTVQARLTAQYRAWLGHAKIALPADTAAIEIDHAVIDSTEEAEACGFSTLHEAGAAIRVATGIDT